VPVAGWSRPAWRSRGGLWGLLALRGPGTTPHEFVVDFTPVSLTKAGVQSMPIEHGPRPTNYLRTEDVRNLSDQDLATLAKGINGYPLARAGDAQAEIARRNREEAQRMHAEQISVAAAAMGWARRAFWISVASMVIAIASVVVAIVFGVSTLSPH
jgi:hypothetical protein